MSGLLWVRLSASVQFFTTTAFPPKSGWTSHAASGDSAGTSLGPQTLGPKDHEERSPAAWSSGPQPPALTQVQHPKLLLKVSLAFQRASGLSGGRPDAGGAHTHTHTHTHASACTPSQFSHASAPPQSVSCFFPSAPDRSLCAKLQHPQRFPNCCHQSGSGEQVSSEGAAARVKTAPAGPSHSHLHPPFIPTVYTLSSAINAFPGTAAG